MAGDQDGVQGVAVDVAIVDQYVAVDRLVLGSREAVVLGCRGVVDRSLAELLRPGMTAEKLFDLYVTFGLDPFIPGEPFSAWDYAKQRAAEMTAPHIDSPPLAPR